MNTKIIKFDINKNLYDTLIAKQGDTKSRFLLFNLLDGSIPFSLENRSVRVYAIKPDGTEIFNDLIITDAAKGYCILELTTQMLAVAGTVKLELMVIEDEKKLTSNIFYMDVKKSINSEKAVVSTNEFGALLTALSSLNEYDNYKKEIAAARDGEANLLTKVKKIDEQLEHVALEVKKPITLNNCDEEMLGAIKNKEGITEFSLLSIPRDLSVSPSKVENNFLQSFVDYSLIKFEYEEGAVNTNGTLNNNIKDRYRSTDFIEFESGYTLNNNSDNDIFLFQYSKKNANTGNLISKTTLNKKSTYIFKGQGYLLVDLFNNKLESGNLVFLEVLGQKEIKDKSVALKKLADDTLNYLNNKVEKVELTELKKYFNTLFEMNGLLIGDSIDIPDKFNTGIQKDITLEKAQDNSFIKNGIEFNFRPTSESVEFPDGKEISVNVATLDNINEINNIDFTNVWEFIFGNETNIEVERVVIINNCKFNSLRTARRDEVNIKYIFNNCEIGTFLGSRCTFNNCMIGGLPYDGTNPYRECYFNNCYITELSPDGTYNWTNSLHLDGTQISGYNSVENNNIYFRNCRFECLPLPRSNSTVYVNACIMLSLDYNNARNILFEDCIINGGGYSIYLQNNSFEFENVSLKNIRVGCSYKYGILYKNEINGVKYENVRETDSLFIGSCWKDETGIHISVTNDTNQERKLKIITENGEYEFTIPKCLLYSEMLEDVTVFSDFPFDMDKVVNDDSRWVKCYDITDTSKSKLIKTKIF